MIPDPITEHRLVTKELAESLDPNDIYHWLVEHGYFPESYVLPPCFRVTRHPEAPKQFTKASANGRQFNPPSEDLANVHFPKTDLTDRHFGIIHPHLHNDIAYEIATNWGSITKVLFPDDSDITCYSFPIPVDSRHPGRIGHLTSGRMIYEFLSMAEEDLAAVAHQFTFIVTADIKNFYASVYTHSIAWAMHGKSHIRSGSHRNDFTLLGNRLDRLLQRSNDQCTNGVPIGPVASDVLAEIVATAVDRYFSNLVKEHNINCRIVRFKDDYRILAKDASQARHLIKLLQLSLRDYRLEINESKTSIKQLPEGLFRSWASLYHTACPRKRSYFRWKDFRELYLSVIRIDLQHPNTGVIDRFLADIVSRNGDLKVRLNPKVLQRTISMLLMLSKRRAKSLPKVLAIIESILRTDLGADHDLDIVSYLESHLEILSKDGESNRYELSWIWYFVISNNLKRHVRIKPIYIDPVVRSVFTNRPIIFKDVTDFTLFEGCRKAGRRASMLEYLDIFNPPRPT